MFEAFREAPPVVQGIALLVLVLGLVATMLSREARRWYVMTRDPFDERAGGDTAKTRSVETKGGV